MNFAAILLTLAALALPAAAARVGEAARPIACAGPFGRDTSHDRLIAAFGAENVAFGKVDGPEGSENEATILFGVDPQRRLEVTWRDTAGRARPEAIWFSGTGWIAPKGLRIGQTLEAVAASNGAPFRISGFGWDNAGLTSFPRGALAAVPGGCRLTLRFAPTLPEPLGRRFAPITGNREIRSGHPLMRAARPKVVEIFLHYP